MLETMLGRLMCGSTRDMFAKGSFTFLTQPSLKINNNAGGWLNLLQKILKRDNQSVDESESPHFHSGQLNVL